MPLFSAASALVGVTFVVKLFMIKVCQSHIEALSGTAASARPAAPPCHQRTNQRATGVRTDHKAPIRSRGPDA
ncbi:hypothetical protein FHS42_004631 [Streptomyces zagrosensis]|uniref:Uncharacterized protein n=1 Tax=Streptomyces zagrosensis TaxID=1042984 RepID=A0A7W9QCC0_9ACTN|nr:hypothetical protein [Streptomyces zagrosensis]